MYLSTDARPASLHHRAYGLTPFIGLVSEFGLDTTPLLEQVGISPDTLDDPEYLLSPDAELSFMALALKKLDLPELGLLCGPRYHLTFYGVLGLAAMTSENLLEAFRAIFDNILMTWTYMHWSLSVTDGQATIALEKQRDLGGCYQYMVDRGLTAAYTIACDASGQNLPLREVNVRQPAPDYAARYSEVFRCPVNFGADTDDLRFDDTYLYAPLPGAEADSARIFSHQCRKICDSLAGGGGFSEVVRQYLLQQPNEISSLDKIAESLHVTPRTIQRKLAAENTNFQELSERVRCNLAMEYLNTTDMRLEEVAFRLGYSDLAGFSHAFKRWTGQPPSSIRRPSKR